MTAELQTLAKSAFPVRLLRAFRLRPAALLQHLLYTCYYRYIFGRKNRLAMPLAEKIASLERRQRRGDIPMPQGTWESQYLSGQWNYLNQLEELPRYSVIASCVQFLKPGGSILDVGCGEGVLLEHLSSATSKYVGIDISQTAIEKAAKKASPRNRFIQADAQGYIPEECFDAIIFNEVLYYMNQPLDVVQRYEAWLKPRGVLITSFYQKSMRAVAISSRLNDRYNSIGHIGISTKSAAWIIDVVAPRLPVNARHSWKYG